MRLSSRRASAQSDFTDYRRGRSSTARMQTTILSAVVAGSELNAWRHDVLGRQQRQRPARRRIGVDLMRGGPGDDVHYCNDMTATA